MKKRLLSLITLLLILALTACNVPGTSLGDSSGDNSGGQEETDVTTVTQEEWDAAFRSNFDYIKMNGEETLYDDYNNDTEKLIIDAELDNKIYIVTINCFVNNVLDEQFNESIPQESLPEFVREYPMSVILSVVDISAAFAYIDYSQFTYYEEEKCYIGEYYYEEYDSAFKFKIYFSDGKISKLHYTETIKQEIKGIYYNETRTGTMVFSYSK